LLGHGGQAVSQFTGVDGTAKNSFTSRVEEGEIGNTGYMAVVRFVRWLSLQCLYSYLDYAPFLLQKRRLFAALD